ncbi:MAG TPA: hypothetical protein VGM12_25500 [Trebonia sp.]|jgi:uncharacterized membrane protein
MAAWNRMRQAGWSTRAVVAAVALAVLLVAAVPAALVAGIILMLFGHALLGLAVFGASILAAGAGVVTAGVTGVWRVKQAVRSLQRTYGLRDDGQFGPFGQQDQDQDRQQDHPVVQLDESEYRYS